MKDDFAENLEILAEIMNSGFFMGFTCSGFDQGDSLLEFPCKPAACCMSTVARVLWYVIYNDVWNSRHTEPGRNRILLSGGIHFKAHLKTYGGDGLNLFYDILNIIDSKAQLVSPDSAELVMKLFTRNALRFLSFVYPSDVQQETVVMQKLCIVCAGTVSPKVCYEKYSFTYCSMTCLEGHRRNGYTKL